MALVKIQSAKAVARLLQQGELVVIPTETSYGLAADATNAQAVARVFAVKGRGAAKALPIIAADIAMVQEYAVISPVEAALAAKYWPGPLTIVLPLKKRAKLFPEMETRPDMTAAFRVSGLATARAIARVLGRPITATSANLSGQPNVYSMRALRRQFRQIPGTLYVLDAGTLSRRKPSTLVRVDGTTIMIVRQGAVHPQLS